MSTTIDIEVPDIGDYKDVPVIEVFVKPGDLVKAEDPLVSLESDKATMDVPAPRGGKVKSVGVKVGDKVSEGSVIMAFEAEGSVAAALAEPAKPSVSAPPSAVNAPAGLAEVRVPDIGDFKDVPVIEIFVKVGDTVKAEDPLVSLESDKATMDVPAPLSGTVQAIKVTVGDKVSEGSVILTLVTGDATAAVAAAPARAMAAPVQAAASAVAAGSGVDETAFMLAYAGPAVRKDDMKSTSWLTGYERSTMGDMIKRAGLPIAPDPRPIQRFFERSDNVAFARLGIPAHTLSSYGMHSDYHTPSDDVTKIDFPHMARVVEAGAKLVRLLADGPKPEWHPGGKP